MGITAGHPMASREECGIVSVKGAPAKDAKCAQGRVGPRAPQRRATAVKPGQIDWDVIEAMVKRSNGIPETVGAGIKNAATSAAF